MGGGPDQVQERYAAASMMRLLPRRVPRIAVIGSPALADLRVRIEAGVR